MAESTHHKGTSKNDDRPPRAHIERTRDVFKATMAPAIKQQPAEPEAKPVKRPEHKERRKTAAEKENELEQERLEEEEQRAKDIAEHEERIGYSNYYYGKRRAIRMLIFPQGANRWNWQYLHVTLPKEIAQWIPHSGTLADDEWRSLGVKQSYGWVHYMVHAPEPHVLLFKRLKDYQNKFPNKKPQDPVSDLKSSKSRPLDTSEHQ
ncbi:hypothetical protein INT44_006055, partial [Umbelopsis vinacea]